MGCYNVNNFTLDDNSEGISIYAIVKHHSEGTIWDKNSKSLVYKSIENIRKNPRRQDKAASARLHVDLLS